MQKTKPTNCKWVKQRNKKVAIFEHGKPIYKQLTFVLSLIAELR